MKNQLLACVILLAATACSGSSADDTAAPGDTGQDGGTNSTKDASVGPDGAGVGPDGAILPLADGSAPPHVDAGTPGHDAGTVVPSTGVDIIVEPNGNDASELVAAINAATTSVYMTMYEIDNPSVLTGLVNKKKAGVDVKVVLDSSANTKTTNQAAYTQLQTGGVGVVWSSTTFTYTHEKCVIIDSKQAWIMTMNLMKSSPVDDREYLAVDNDAADVAEAQAIFLADYANQSISPTGGLVVAPTNARPMLVSLIASAKKTLDIEVEEFSDTDKNGIVDAVVAAAQSGVTVRVVIANMTLTSAQTSSNAMAKAAGASVVMSGGQSNTSTPSDLYISAKTILVDCGAGSCTGGYVGSENFTANSVEYNRELGVILADPAQLAKIETAVAADFAAGTPQ